MEPNPDNSSQAHAASSDSKRVRSYFKARRAEYSDIPALKILSEEECNKEIFAGQHLEQLIEHSLISVTVLEQTKRFEHITGYASFNDLPTRVLGGVKNWPEIIQRSLPFSYFSTANSVFLTSLVSEPRNCEEVLEECLKVLFTINPELDYCLLLTEATHDPLFDKYFPAWMDFKGDEISLHLAVCKKEYVWPEVVLREAVTADVPNVLPFFEKIHDKLRGSLGEDWLEKIVRASPSSKDTKCCVVEDVNGQICGFFSVTSSNIDWDYLHDQYETRIFHEFRRITDFDRIAGRVSNCDVELGKADSGEDYVFGPRESIPSTPHVEEEDTGRRKRRHKKREKQPEASDSIEDDLPLTSSVEEYIAQVLDDLCNITVDSADETSETPGETAGSTRVPSSSNFTNLPVHHMTAEDQDSSIPATSDPRGTFSSVTNLPILRAEGDRSSLDTSRVSGSQHFTNIPGSEVPEDALPDGSLARDPSRNFTNFPILSTTDEDRTRTSEFTERLKRDTSFETLTNIPVYTGGMTLPEIRRQASSTASYLISAEGIISELLANALDGAISAADLASRTSIDQYERNSVADPRTLDRGVLEERGTVVADFSKKLDAVLSRLRVSLGSRSSIDLFGTPDVRDVLQDFLDILEANAAKFLDLQSLSLSTQGLTTVGSISRTTVTAIESLVMDIERLAQETVALDEIQQPREISITNEEGVLILQEQLREPSLSDESEPPIPTHRHEISITDENGVLIAGDPLLFSIRAPEEPILEVETEATAVVDPIVEVSPDTEPEATPPVPVLSTVTVTTLQLLISHLVEENRELEKEQTAVHELVMRLTPRQLHLSYPPKMFAVDSSIVVPGEFQLRSTNIAGLCPVERKDSRENRHSTDGVNSDLQIPARGPATTARLSQLAFGMDDVLGQINFAVKKPDVPVYDSDTGLSSEKEVDDDGTPRPKKKILPPVEIETPEQALERTYKKEYGIMDTANEPMFNSWDDLIKAPQPFIATVREEPGIRSLQKKANRFFQNPILGRAATFNYISGNGEQNGMYLLLFHLDELRSPYLDKVLAHCFAVLPDFDYLITQMPTAQRSSPLLNKFMRTALRPGHFLREDLFVLHISTLLRCDDLEFTDGLPGDVHPMSQFLAGKADGTVLLAAFAEAVHYHTNCQAIKLIATVFRISGAIIGFVIYSQETELEYLLAHYNVDDYLYQTQHRTSGHMRIFHYIINPMFNWMNPFIIQELMKQSKSSSIFYRFYPLDRQLERNDSFPCCLDKMNLIRPRLALQFPGSANWKLLPASIAMDRQEPFALYHTNRRLLFDSKSFITDRIIIVGASDTSIQVLRNLALFTHVRFTNLILIDPHGVAATDQRHHDSDESVFATSRRLFSVRELHQLAIPVQCQLIYGRAITMNKSLRVLHVNDKLRIPFDYMVIGTGRQFLTFNINVDTDWLTALANGDIAQKRTTDFPRLMQQQTRSLLNNYFVVNNAYESECVLSKLERLREDVKGQGYFVVYGAALEGYSCVNSLLNLGVQPGEIIFVDPLAAFSQTSAFASTDLEAWMRNVLFSHGIVVILEWIPVAYNEGQGGDTINTVTFWTDEGSLKTYHVQAFFNFTDRQMNPFTYSFLNSSYLIVDKNLVIDENFHAFAPRIYAGGAWCKYPRRHFVGNFQFGNVNSREIGDMVSWELIGSVCPGMAGKPSGLGLGESTVPDFPRLPRFHRPIVESAKLPFGWYYCNIHSPQTPVAGTSTASSANSNSSAVFQSGERRLLSTGSIAEGNLFEIYLDSVHLVDQITCVTRFPLKVESLAILHGMHEGWLELIQRFEDGFIKDFFDYIQQLWLSCVFYDRFPALCGELRRLVLNDQGDGNSLSVIEMINQCFKNQELPRTQGNVIYEEIMRRVRLTGIKFDQVEAIGNFLENNAYALTMYTNKFNEGEDLPGERKAKPRE